MKEKHFLIVYDIRDNKRLVKVSKCIQSYGWRIQKSIFETKATEKTILQLKIQLEKIVEKDEDFVLFFEICEKDWEKRQILGKINKNQEIIDNDENFVIL